MVATDEFKAVLLGFAFAAAVRMVRLGLMLLKNINSD